MTRYNERGQEIPDPTPVEIPLHLQRAISRHEEMKAYIRAELARQAADEGFETFEEADDFEVDEDPDPLSQYEMTDAAPEWPGGVKDEDGDPPGPPGEKKRTEAVLEPPRGTPDLRGAVPGALGPGDGGADPAAPVAGTAG